MISLVRGCKDVDFAQEITKSAHFFAKELLSPQMRRNIYVDIVFKDNLPDLGNCSITFFNDWYKPRYFEIQLRKRRSLKNTLITLAHEFVHLKQFAKGELKDDHTRWKGQPIDPAQIDYNDHPWEIEATSMEVLLYEAYIEDNK